MQSNECEAMKDRKGIPPSSLKAIGEMIIQNQNANESDPRAFVDDILAEARAGAESMILQFRTSCVSWFEVYYTFGWPSVLGTKEQAKAIAALEWMMS